ncbi:MAG: hypothetical protein GX491_10255 [Chloroflexi bacterium]|nr:hypothetical protein [Chloroflexota bacterium]
MSEAQNTIQRFSLAQRIEHFVLLASFTTLALTGLPQKYPLNEISQAVISFLGGIETIRVIHRVAATVFLLEAVYHVVVVAYKLFVQRKEASMVPTLKDAQDAIQAFKYNLGLTKEPPKMPRYNFTEKAEYWAMIWGLGVMAVTGFMLWNPIATARILPGEFIPAAKIAHGGEAVLAVLAIILWHFYHVHIRHFNKSIFTGRLDRKAMAEEHGAELEMIESGRVPEPPPPAVVQQRMRIFTPVAGVVSLAMLAGVFVFVTFEQSAITTIPGQQAEVFAPQTPTPLPPTRTPRPTATLDPNAPPPVVGVVGWMGGIEMLMQEKCTDCHGTDGGFNAETYDDVLAAVTPGEPYDSELVEVQLPGNHRGQFTEEELAYVIEWIQAGAPLQGTGEIVRREPPTTYANGLGDLFLQRCGNCHGFAGGFNARTYTSVMRAIQPGNPNASLLVQTQRDEDHPGQFRDDELDWVIRWIEAGAPEE